MDPKGPDCGPPHTDADPKGPDQGPQSSSRTDARWAAGPGPPENQRRIPSFI